MSILKKVSGFLLGHGMNIDKRVVNFTAIASCFSSIEGVRFSSVNKKGYFADKISDFSNLDDCVYGTLEQVDDSESPFKMYDGKFYNFFLAEIFVEKPEEKYRPYTLEEFSCKFEYGDFITFKRKHSNFKIYAMYTGLTYDENNDNPENIIVMLGDSRYSLQELFDDYELCDDAEDWIPFGVSYYD